MTPLDNLTSAFECLWEAKVHLLRACEAADEPTRAALRPILAEVATARDHIEHALVKLPPPPAPVPVPPQG